MAERLNIRWRSKIFLILRTLQLLLAIAVLAIIILFVYPSVGSKHYPQRYRRSPIPGPRRGGSGSSDSYPSSSSSSNSFGETYARYATPFIAIPVAGLTILWCIATFIKYFRRTLRPTVSMGWDTVFSILWLSLVICNAIGMVEVGAWGYPPDHFPILYTIFITSVVIFLIFIWSHMNAKRALREIRADDPVPASIDATQMGVLPPIPVNSPIYYNTRQQSRTPQSQQSRTPQSQQYNLPQQFSTTQPYNADNRQPARASYSQRYSTHPHHVGPRYVPPTSRLQYNTSPTQGYYQPPPAWNTGRIPPR